MSQLNRPEDPNNERSGWDVEAWTELVLLADPVLLMQVNTDDREYAPWEDWQRFKDHLKVYFPRRYNDKYRRSSVLVVYPNRSALKPSGESDPDAIFDPKALSFRLRSGRRWIEIAGGKPEVLKACQALAIPMLLLIRRTQS